MLKHFPKILRQFIAAVSLSILIFSCGPKDAEVQTAVDTALRANNDLSGLTATVKDGVVTLTGETKDETLKAKAEEIAKGVKGVKNVINNSTVAAPPPAPAPVVISADETLSNSVNEVLKDFPGVKAEIKDGVITVTGELKRDSWLKLRPMLDALRPKKVENKLTIK